MTNVEEHNLFTFCSLKCKKATGLLVILTTAEKCPAKAEGKKKKCDHIKEALKTCGYPTWAYVKSSKHSGKNVSTIKEEEKKRHHSCSSSVG